MDNYKMKTEMKPKRILSDGKNLTKPNKISRMICFDGKYLIEFKTNFIHYPLIFFQSMIDT